MQVVIFHNIDDSAFFGYRSGQPVTPVFVYESGARNETIVLNEAFDLFNIGGGPTSQAYRARRLRSLSVGDVVRAGDQFFAVARLGFSEVSFASAKILLGEEAERVIRARYQITDREPLAITVPLPRLLADRAGIAQAPPAAARDSG